MNILQLKKYKTDEERLKVYKKIGAQNFLTLHDWAEEARTPEVGKLFADYAVHLYHKDNRY